MVVAQVTKNALTDDMAVLLKQGDVSLILTLQTEDGRIAAVRRSVKSPTP